MRRLILLAALLLAATASAQTLKLPRYWAVHIDYPRPDARAELEHLGQKDAAVRREFYTARKTAMPPMWALTTSDGAYLTFRPRESFSDFDKPSPLPEDARKELAAKTSPLSDLTHLTLRTHHNELLETDTDVTLLHGTAAPKFIRVRQEQEIPAKHKEYGEVMKKVREACERNHVDVLALFSTYGDGSYRYVFLSGKPIDIRATVGPELFAEWRAVATGQRELDGQARVELAEDAAHWLVW